MITGREEDRLLFDHQRELARLWGFVDGEKLAVEQFMQLYYRWALALAQLNEVLMLAFDQAVLQAEHATTSRRSTTASSCATVTSVHAPRNSVFLERPARCSRCSCTPATTPRPRGSRRRRSACCATTAISR
jgi:UTP:GlnB (protein PII) uridylyltransferase